MGGGVVDHRCCLCYKHSFVEFEKHALQLVIHTHETQPRETQLGRKLVACIALLVQFMTSPVPSCLKTIEWLPVYGVAVLFEKRKDKYSWLVLNNIEN